MGDLIQFVSANHPLVGTWQGDDEDGRVQYKVSVKNGKFHVSGVDVFDGEVLQISEVSWDAELGVLTFESLMPSIERRGVMSFRLMGENQVEVEFTFTYRRYWIRID